MKSSLIKGLSVMALAMTLAACKEEAQNSNGTTTQASSDSSLLKDGGNTSCTVTQLSNGARIDCGNSSATVLNGSDGSQGPGGSSGSNGPQGLQGIQGPIGPRGPAGVSSGAGALRLVDGDGSIVGDVVVSASSTYSAAPNDVTVYDAAMDAVAVYHAGKLSADNESYVGYFSTDCTGTAYHLYGDITAEAPRFQGDYIYGRGGKWFKITGQIAYTYVRSIVGSGGGCEAYTSSTYSRVHQIAEPITLTIPTVLKPGYAIKLR